MKSSEESADCKLLQVSKMEFGFQHERKQMRRMTELEDGKRLLPKSKLSVELPFDVIVSILTRLPARHLLRMRSVCMSWSSLISDSHFIREYSKFRASVANSPNIISIHRCYSRCYRFQITCKMKFFPEGDDYHHEFDVGSYFGKMSNSCDGLICVVGNAFTYLVNPSIQKVRTLMERSWHFKMPFIHSAGLGFNDSTGEYKVVRLYHRKVGQHGYLGCEVYTIGNLHSPCNWKVIDGPSLEPLSYSLPVFVNGVIHWTVNNGPDEVPPEIVISFNVKSEKFDVILHPEGSSRPSCSRVVGLGGLLCLADTHRDGVRMDIWVLKDYNNREWIRQYRIDLSVMHDYDQCLAFRTKPVAIHDRKIVFCNDDGSFVKHIYDPQSKSFVKNIHDPQCKIFAKHLDDIAYNESIVWPMARITT